MVYLARPGTAVGLAVLQPQHYVTPELLYLREIERGVRVLAWMKTEDAHRKPPRNIPDRLPLPGEEEPAGHFDVMTEDELRERLDPAFFRT